MLGALHPNQNFFEGPTPPISKLKFPPYDKIADSLHNKRFFSDSPEGFAFFGASGEHI